jgi:hypothetical protein
LEGSCGFLIKDLFLNLPCGTVEGENKDRGKEDMRRRKKLLGLQAPQPSL